MRAWKARGAVVTLSAFAYAWYSEHNLTHARDAAFSVLVVAELLRAFGARSETRTVWQMGLLSNRPLCVIVIASLALQLALHHLPALQALFGTRLSRCASMRHGSCSGLSPSSPWKCARSSAGPRLGMPTRCQVQ